MNHKYPEKLVYWRRKVNRWQHNMKGAIIKGEEVVMWLPLLRERLHGCEHLSWSPVCPIISTYLCRVGTVHGKWFALHRHHELISNYEMGREYSRQKGQHAQKSTCRKEHDTVTEQQWMEGEIQNPTLPQKPLSQEAVLTAPTPCLCPCPTMFPSRIPWSACLIHPDPSFPEFAYTKI